VVFSIEAQPASDVTIIGSALKKVKAGSTLGTVTVKASQAGDNDYAPCSATVTFVIGNKNNQELIFPDVGAAGGVRDLPLGRRPFFLPNIMTSRGLQATLTVTAPDVDDSTMFVRDGRKLILKGTGLIKVTAYHPGNNDYFATAEVSRIFTVKEPGRDAFFEERRVDDRYSAKKTEFIARMQHLVDGLSAADAAALFDEDSADSDGDGVNNLLERAFGMDSLGPDERKSLPRIRTKDDGKQRFTFVRYNSTANTEGIEYKVEVSTDLRVWMEGSSFAVEEGTPVDIGGGMERVTYVTVNTAAAAGGRQYMRLTVSAP